jgi:hypothetical protein
LLRISDFRWLAPALVVFYFFALAGMGLWSHWAPDDMQNLYYYWSHGVPALIKANILFATTYYRPMGGVFYLPLYAIAGLNPVPNRIVCFALLLLNIWLSYALARRLIGDRGAAVLAALIGCFHGSALGIYVSNSIIYEILCFTFEISALLYYVRVRQMGRPLKPHEIAIVLLLYVCALNSKEMAVMLPLWLAAYEWWYRDAPGLRVRTLVPVAIAGGMALIYAVGKMHGSDSLAQFEAYRPSFTVHKYFETSQGYLNLLFYSNRGFNSVKTILFWVALFALAYALRSRAMKFAALFALFSFLPLNFVNVREGFALYIPLFGFSTYVAALWTAAMQAARLAPVQRLQATAIAVVACAFALGLVHHAKAQRILPFSLHAQENTWMCIQELRRLDPPVKSGQRVLFLDSPFGTDWDTYFIAKLHFGDPSVRVAFANASVERPVGDAHEAFDHVFRFVGRTLIEERSPRMNANARE